MLTEMTDYRKIKRVVFESVSKYNGKADVPLTVSQIKQIAGRAGRYGLHGADQDGGVCVTLREDGMAPLRAAIAAPQTPLACAYLQDMIVPLFDLVGALPPTAPLAAVYAASDHVFAPKRPYRGNESRHKVAVTELLDKYCSKLDLSERLHLARAPARMRNPTVADGLFHFCAAYSKDLHVRLRRSLGPSGLLKHLEGVKQTMRDPNARATQDTLGPLESLHNLLVLYIWLGYRNPVVWADMEDAVSLKAETEEAMNWALSVLKLDGRRAGNGYGNGNWGGSNTRGRFIGDKDRQAQPDFAKKTLPMGVRDPWKSKGRKVGYV
jgi:ATP-dependent RNA helicase SUPV3L1/SUV3